MPKMKTHKGTAKRVKITGTGKVLMMAHHRNNKRMKKGPEQHYAIREMVGVSKTHTNRLRKLLPYAGI